MIKANQKLLIITFIKSLAYLQEYCIPVTIDMHAACKLLDDISVHFKSQFEPYLLSTH